MSKVVLQNLNVFREQQIIFDLSLDIAAGEFCVLVGPSGCGKSSLLEVIAGLVSSFNGEIYVNDNEITQLNIKDREIGYVFQEFALYPNMTVEQNIEFGLKIRKIPKKERKQISQEILTAVELIDKAKQYPHQLSGGQKQRVAIARSLVLEPKVMLMDEPLSSLDAYLRISLAKYIRQLHDQHEYTTIYVTHDHSEALALADKLVVMNEGKIMQVGTAREVFNEPVNEFVLRFFNPDKLNQLNIVDAKKLGFNLNDETQRIFVRSKDVRIVTGDKWQVKNVQIKGNHQDIILRNTSDKEFELILTCDSEYEYKLDELYNVQVKRYFEFNQQGERIVKK